MGDRAAFDELYAELRPRALRFAQAKLGLSEAPDVAQAALVKVFLRASDFTPGRPCLPWFYAIVGNEIRGARRRASRTAGGNHPSERIADPAPSAEDTLLAAELERALELAIRSLDDEAEAAIGAMLGRVPAPKLNPAAFRKRVSRAYAKLRLVLGGPDDD